MMYRKRLYLDIFCAFSGDFFSPKKLQALTGLTFTVTREVGEKSTYGIVYDCGSATLYPPEDYDDSASDVLDWFLETLETHIEAIRESGTDDLTMWILYPLEGQKNWEFSAEQISRMGKLGLAVCFSATEREDSDMKREIEAMYEKE